MGNYLDNFPVSLRLFRNKTLKKEEFIFLRSPRWNHWVIGSWHCGQGRSTSRQPIPILGGRLSSGLAPATRQGQVWAAVLHGPGAPRETGYSDKTQQTHHLQCPPGERSLHPRVSKSPSGMQAHAAGSARDAKSDVSPTHLSCVEVCCVVFCVVLCSA